MSLPVLKSSKYTHALEIAEVEYLMRFRHKLEMPRSWAVAVSESLKGKGYLSDFPLLALTDKSIDWFETYSIQSLQTRIMIWSYVTFKESVLEKQERAYRFGEEALELIQSCGVSAEDLHKLIDYVYNRPKGELAQEVGGVFTTLAVLCSVHDENLTSCAEIELDRIWHRLDNIRAKQLTKPKASPLQGDGNLKGLIDE